jgi:hypothetical protein
MGSIRNIVILGAICSCVVSSAFGDEAGPPTTAPATRPARVRAPRVALPDKHADEILAMRLDPDAATCALGRRYNLNMQVGHDFAGRDTDLQQRAADVLEKVSFHETLDSGGARIVPDEPGWCRWNLRKTVLKPLMALQKYDLVNDMALKALSDGKDAIGKNAAGLDNAQLALVNALLATGKYDDALPAAKTYYNISNLENTSKATDLLAIALVNGPGKTDPTIVDRFKSEQAAGAQPPAGDSSGAALQTVLKSIKVDPAPYQEALDKAAAGPRTYDSLTQQGNLLLLQDKGGDAVPLFQLTVSLTSDPTQMSAAIANVARAMRARDGSIGAANVYILSLQQAAPPKS